MLAIDHIVIAAKDPEQSAHAFGEKHYVTIVEGGKHELWGTYNMLAYFNNDCYLEWLGIFDLEKAEQSENPLIQQLVHQLKTTGDGPFQYALRTQKMDNYIAHLESSHIPYEGPFKGSRVKPNGSTLSWQMLFPTGLSTISPFLIEWGKSINRPEDPYLINERRLCLLAHQHEDLDIFNNIYQTNMSSPELKLDNGSILFSHPADLDFELID